MGHHCGHRRLHHYFLYHSVLCLPPVQTGSLLLPLLKSTFLFYVFFLLGEFEKKKNMDIEQALQHFYVWHTAYPTDTNTVLAEQYEHHCPSLLWLECMTQELLDRMLPYVEVKVNDDLNEDSRVLEDDALQALSLDYCFQLVKHIVQDTAYHVATRVQSIIMGYYTQLSPEECMSRMNSEELEYLSPHCFITFKSWNNVSVCVEVQNNRGPLLARINRAIVNRCHATSPHLTVTCQYRVQGAGNQVLASIYKDSDQKQVADRCVAYAKQWFQEHVTADEDGARVCCYFSAVQEVDGTLRSSFSVNTPLLESDREGEFGKESDWNKYCEILCDQAVNTAYDTIVKARANE